MGCTSPRMSRIYTSVLDLTIYLMSLIVISFQKKHWGKWKEVKSSYWMHLTVSIQKLILFSVYTHQHLYNSCKFAGEKHSSHFSIDQAIDTSRNLKPKPRRTYLVGFAHRIEHYALTREMEELQRNEPDLWVRPAHDGLRVGLEELLPKQSCFERVLQLIFGA